MIYLKDLFLYCHSNDFQKRQPACEYEKIVWDFTCFSNSELEVGYNFFSSKFIFFKQRFVNTISLLWELKKKKN